MSEWKFRWAKDGNAQKIADMSNGHGGAKAAAEEPGEKMREFLLKEQTLIKLKLENDDKLNAFYTS